MNILIIGGSGFLGSHISDELQNRGHCVTILDKKKSKWFNSKTFFISGDITNTSILEKAIKNNDVVYHFAGITDIGEGLKNPLSTAKINIIPTINIMNLCVKNKVKKFIFASTIYVHSSQGGFYRVSKKSSELYIMEFGKIFKLNFNILRYGTIYGPRSNLNNNLSRIIFDALTKNILTYPGSSKALRKMIHVKDAAKLSADILGKKFTNKKVVLITGKKFIHIKEIIKKIKNQLQIKKKTTYENRKNLGHYIKSPYVNKEIKEHPCYPKKFIDIDHGISEMINFMRKEYNI
jgi:UDP-glucose 4-epimerase